MRAILRKLTKYIETEDVKGLVRYCLILLPFVGGGIFGIGAIVAYATRHKEALILIGVAICMIIPVLMEKKSDNAEPPLITTDSNIVFFNRLLTETLYVIFTTYMPQFQTLPPQRYEDLQDVLPSNMDPARNIAVYRFKIISDGEAISQADFHEILNVHLQERIASGELALGKPVAEFGGQLYPKLFIDECVCAGGVWHISLLICDNVNVARYISNKRQTLILRNNRISTQYEDSDF